MMVSHSLRLLIAHVPKAGGSAITATLRPDLECFGREMPVDAHGWQPQYHHGMRMHGPWSRDREFAEPFLADGYRLVAVNRNPWDRVASLWRRIGEPGKSLDRFLAAPERNTRYKGHLIQSIHVTDPERTEWIPYDEMWLRLRGIVREQGGDFDEPVRANVTPDQRKTEEVLTPFAMEWIATHFAREIDYFGHEAPA